MNHIPLYDSETDKLSTSFGWGKGGYDTSAKWQVTLCGPIWYVSSCSGEAKILLTATLLPLPLPFTFDASINATYLVESTGTSEDDV